MAGKCAMNPRELRIQLDQYLSTRSALGIKDRGRKTLLQGFLRYLVKMKYDGAITCRLAIDWATTLENASQVPRFERSYSVFNSHHPAQS